MTENEWAKSIKQIIKENFTDKNKIYEIHQGFKLPYTNENLEYENISDKTKIKTTKIGRFETDLIITEKTSDSTWKPRIIIECKINRVTTHDAITYSQKALLHKNVHPYLRYGILIGNRKQYPLPGRLFRHGLFFDFMLSMEKFKPNKNEKKRLINLIESEIKASQNLEEILYNSRNKNRKRYSLLQRVLVLE